MTNDSTPRRRTTALGITAGLLGGAAVGLVLTVPSLTSAATDESETSTVVALQDDGGDVEPGDADRPAHPARGERIRASLQDLVDDETITADQADAVAEHLAEQVGDRHGRGHRHRAAHAANIVAETIGIDIETLRAELEAGSSVADIAAANGVDVDDVVDALLAPIAERLDRAVENDRLSEDDAAERLEDAEERITARVNGEQPERDMPSDEG